jgi:NADH:ubiquinone oxidoreductase subunit 5 (subunit L)/multisubunit Na+/H+ antiporter MnhA subunit
VHALAKSLLFMVVGMVIYAFLGQQDARFSSFRYLSPFFMVLRVSCLLFLSGLLLTGGFVRKEVIISFFRTHFLGLSFL